MLHSEMMVASYVACRDDGGELCCIQRSTGHGNLVEIQMVGAQGLGGVITNGDTPGYKTTHPPSGSWPNRQPPLRRPGTWFWRPRNIFPGTAPGPGPSAPAWHHADGWGKCPWTRSWGSVLDLGHAVAIFCDDIGCVGGRDKEREMTSPARSLVDHPAAHPTNPGPHRST